MEAATQLILGQFREPSFQGEPSFQHEWLGITVLLAGLTPGAFQAWRGARLLPVEALPHV